MPCLQNSEYTASPVVRWADTETEGNVMQVIVKVKFVAGKLFLMKVRTESLLRIEEKGC